MKNSILVIGAMTFCILSNATAESPSNKMYVYQDKDGGTLLSNRKDDSLTSIKTMTYPVSNQFNYSNSNQVKTAVHQSQKNINNFQKYYKEQDITNYKNYKFEYLKEGENIEIIHGELDDNAFTNLLEDGNALLGVSYFRDYEISDNLAIEQARNVGATTVNIRKIPMSYVSSVNEKADPNAGKFVYRYIAMFFVKESSRNTPDKLGLVIKSIPVESRVIYQRNTGAYVIGALKNTKGYNANILKDDVIISINKTAILSANDFHKIQDSELVKNRTLDFEILRLIGGELKTIVIPITFD